MRIMLLMCMGEKEERKYNNMYKMQGEKEEERGREQDKDRER